MLDTPGDMHGPSTVGRTNNTEGQPNLTVNNMVTQGVNAFARNNVGQQLLEQDSDGESESANKLSRKKIQSGMVALPTDNIKTPQIWPHYNLSYGFVTSAVQFHHIMYEQYVAGEVKTLLNATDPTQIKGRLNLMLRISYLKYKGYSWLNLRTLYAAVVNQIEKHEVTWISDWKHIEDMVLESAVRVSGDKGIGKSSVRGA